MERTLPVGGHERQERAETGGEIMNAARIPEKILAVVVLLAVLAGAAAAQDARRPVSFSSRNLSGPRFGMTYVAGDSDLYRRLRDNDMDRLLSQFGWHFEKQVIPEGGGPQFVVEFVPMFAGVEYGKFVPAATLAMGVRMPSGIEFGLGPNVAVTGTDEDPEAMTSLVLALGKSFDYGGVSIPINVAYATNPDGQRLSLIVGYAIAKAPGR
jgi:hypothetical protein